MFLQFSLFSPGKEAYGDMGFSCSGAPVSNSSLCGYQDATLVMVALDSKAQSNTKFD